MKAPKKRTLVIALAVAFAAVCLSAVVAVAISGNDNDIPGVPLPEPSPLTGSLTDTSVVGLWDYDDVYSVPLARNQLFEATMTPLAAVDFDLCLFTYDTKTLEQGLTNAPRYLLLASENMTPGAKESIRFVPDRSTVSTYFLDVAALYDSSGNYRLEWKKTLLPTPVIETTMPATSKYGGPVKITGTATVDGAPLAGTNIYVMAMPRRYTSYTKLTTVKTSAAGTFTATVKPVISTAYYAKSQWADANTGTPAVGWGFSSPKRVVPAPYLAFSSAPRSAYAGRAFRVTGVLKPSHKTVSSRHVKVSAAKYNGSRYVATSRTFYMRSSGYAWSGRVTLPRGRWRLTLSCGADSLHGIGRGASPRYVVVK